MLPWNKPNWSVKVRFLRRQVKAKHHRWSTRSRWQLRFFLLSRGYWVARCQQLRSLTGPEHDRHDCFRCSRRVDGGSHRMEVARLAEALRKRKDISELSA